MRSYVVSTFEQLHLILPLCSCAFAIQLHHRHGPEVCQVFALCCCRMDKSKSTVEALVEEGLLNR